MGERKRRAAAGSVTGGDWKSYRLDQGPCLNCGVALNGLTGPAERPDKGSIMICGECGYVMEWDGERLAEVSEAAMAELSEDPAYEQVLAITRVLRNLPLKEGDRIVMLEPRKPETCEECGKVEELRPYGHKKPDGKRKWVCFECAHKDEAELNRAFDERLRGENEV